MRIREEKYVIPYQNCFEAVLEEEILKVEQSLKIRFPEQLRQFYLEVGHGNISIPRSSSKEYHAYHSNEILSPEEILDILKSKSPCNRLDPRIRFKKGEIPFFHVSDGDYFLTLKVGSEDSNMVYNPSGQKVDEFNDLIQRIYDEDSSYYLNLPPVSELDEVMKHLKKSRLDLIKKWETENQDQWPMQYLSKMNKWDLCYAFMIVPLEVGGPIEWWNLHPVTPEQRVKIMKESKGYSTLFANGGIHAQAT
jgi:hypothetical protein